MTTPISSQLKAQGPFPLVDAKDVIGGFKSVPDIATRDTIPQPFRTAGMRVTVVGSDGTGITGRVFVLSSDMNTWVGQPTPAEVQSGIDAAGAAAGGNNYLRPATITERDAIPTNVRRNGMIVHVNATNTEYRLAKDNTNPADAGVWEVVESRDDYFIGGYRSLSTLSDRDAIPTTRRKAGMRVKVLGDDGTGITGRDFVLGADLTTWTGLATQAELRDRSSQTGTQSADTLTESATALVYRPNERTQVSALSLTTVTSPDDDDITPTPPLPAALAFGESLARRARAFVLRDGGFAGKVFAFIYGKQPQDDDIGTPIWGLMLADGKLPFQADSNWRFFFKMQDRAVALIGATLGIGLKSLWRGTSAAINRMSGDAILTALIDDTTVVPNWFGPIRMPRSGSATITIGDAGAMVMLHYKGQSNSITSGSGSPTTFDTPRFPYHALKFSIGRRGDGNSAVDATTLNALAVLNDDTGNASYPMTIVAFLAQYWSRWHGEKPKPYLCRADAEGGIDITRLIKGSAGYYFYDNGRKTRIAALARAKEYGVDLDYRLVFVQGEDPSVATDLYQTYLSDNIIDADLVDSLTDIGRRPTSFLILQTNGLTDGTNDQRPGPLAHLAETRARRGSIVALACPMYQFPVCLDTIHSDNTGRQMHADLVNYVQREIGSRGGFAPLDIARDTTPALAADQGIRAPGLSAGTKITGLGTGIGGLGTYTVNNSQTAPATYAMNGVTKVRRFVAFGAVFEGSIAGTTLTVTKIVDGALAVAVSGAQVDVRLNRPVKVDTDWVPSVGPALGWEWNDSLSRTVVSAAPLSSDTIRLTLSGAAGTARTLGYAISNCGSSYLKTGGASGANWTATRGQIYNDTGVEASAFVLAGVGTATIRNYLIRLMETF